MAFLDFIFASRDNRHSQSWCSAFYLGFDDSPGMTKYLITGGNGVFGVHAALHLLAEADPERVICVGRNVERPEPFTLGLGRDDTRYAYHQIHPVYELDRFFDLLDEEKPDIIVNFAALSEVATSFRKAWRYYETNVTPLAKITDHLLKASYLKRFIHIGSSEIYGSVDAPVHEDAPIVPSSPYAASKACSDMHLIAIGKVLNFPMNILQPSNCYGPGQLLYRILPKTVLCALTGQKLPLEGGGRAQKSICTRRTSRAASNWLRNARLRGAFIIIWARRSLSRFALSSRKHHSRWGCSWRISSGSCLIGPVRT